MTIYVVICSCHKYALRRETVRLTWLKRLPSNMTARFIVGDGPKIEEPDVVQLSAPDDYDSLWLKMREAFRYALGPSPGAEPTWDFLFKCDDDTYVVPERLESAIRAEEIGLPHYIGRPCDHNPQYFGGGPGYILSRWLVEKLAVAKDCPDPLWGEDGWVGFHARRLVTLRPSMRFTGVPHAGPAPENDLITSHQPLIEGMFRAHAHYVCASPAVPTL